MRNFILGKTLVAASDTFVSIDDVEAGAVGFGVKGSGDHEGEISVKAAPVSDNIEQYIILGRSQEKGGPVILPFYLNHFSFAVGKYQAATTFEASLPMPAELVAGEEYTVIAVKKGVKFNERNKWTASVVAKDSDTSATLAAKLVKYFMDGTVARYGIRAEVVTENDVTGVVFTGEVAGIDWEIVPADALSGTTVTTETHGVPAYGDASYVKDLANKAAADAGFEYTYMGDVNYLYPDYPINPLANPDASDSGFTIITLRFAEPRKVKTVDEVIHQIVQIALPSGVDTDDLEDALTELTQ